MMSPDYYDYPTPLGPMRLKTQKGQLTEAFFLQTTTAQNDKVGRRLETPLLREAGKQLSEYFAGMRQTFDLPFSPRGTEFQQKVWRALCDIPFGDTKAYGELARDIQHPKAARAVGQAAHRNPIGVFIPCHRLIGATGKLVGYAGGISMKAALLVHEQVKEKRTNELR